MTNSPSTYQRLMDTVLGKLRWSIALVYLDDIVVFSKTFESHLANLDLVFQALRKSGLTLKPSKCHFAKHQLEFLGHIISEQGISVNPAKVRSIREFPTPKKVKDVQSFLALCNYYRKFIPKFSVEAHELNKLTYQKTPFVWNEVTEKTFNRMKELLTQAPVLNYPRDEGELTISLHTDASNRGLGATLYQTQDGEKRLLAYASRVLSESEKNYGATQKVGLAVVWAV